MKPTYVSGYDPWPYEYCLWAIQFLAQSEKELSGYLPEHYPSFTAEIHTGNQTFVGPLDALVEYCRVCISPGRTWCEWDESGAKQCTEIEVACTKILKKLNAMSIENYDHEQECRALLDTNLPNEWLIQLSACREIAKQALELTGWREDKIVPIFTALELLDEMSGKSFE